MNKLEIFQSTARNGCVEPAFELLLDGYRAVKVSRGKHGDICIAELDGPELDGWLTCQVALDELIEALVDIRRMMRTSTPESSSSNNHPT